MEIAMITKCDRGYSYVLRNQRLRALFLFGIVAFTQASLLVSKIPSKQAKNSPKRPQTSLNGAMPSKWFIDVGSVDQNQQKSHLLGNWQNLSLVNGA
jgi:hypothetical protein